jgi:hypothetical protein
MCIGNEASFAPRNQSPKYNPNSNPALLKLSAIISQWRFTAAFHRKVFGKRDCRAKDPRADRALKALA